MKIRAEEMTNGLKTLEYVDKRVRPRVGFRPAGGTPARFRCLPAATETPNLQS